MMQIWMRKNASARARIRFKHPYFTVLINAKIETNLPDKSLDMIMKDMACSQCRCRKLFNDLNSFSGIIVYFRKCLYSAAVRKMCCNAVLSGNFYGDCCHCPFSFSVFIGMDTEIRWFALKFDEINTLLNEKVGRVVMFLKFCKE